jgi:hypothetical protein
MGDWDGPTGVLYERARDEMRITRELLEQREHKGFQTREEAYEFGDKTHCMIRAYSPMHQDYRYVNHTGESLTHHGWTHKYENIFFYARVDEDTGKVKRVNVEPNRFADTENARVFSEITNGLREPLYYRDYFRPTGYFNEERGQFNQATPFKTFARETGTDISYIYTFLEHIAGENYIYLLAWLREKLINPCKKTEVVPIFVSKVQGTGKSTFAEVICSALFEEENVRVSHQYDSSSRFNADHADALIVCLEEKKQDDKRNDASALKSSVTATKIRKEQKGIDPIYQESYTDYVMTTNGEVPIKFDSAVQRRFMVIEVDDDFTRDNPLADEVFTKLYGYNGNGDKMGPGLKNDRQAIEQFKWDLLNNKQAAGTNPRDFIKTDAYNRCFQMPRTNEAVEIEALIKALAPFIRDSLVKRQRIENLFMEGEEGQIASNLIDIIPSPEGFQFYRAFGIEPNRVCINRMVVFVDQFTSKPFAHSTVERALLDAKKWLKDEYGILLLGNVEPPKSGFKLVASRYRMSPCAWFVLAGDVEGPQPRPKSIVADDAFKHEVAIVGGQASIVATRIGERVRYSEKTYQPDMRGVLETLNELKPGSTNRGKESAQYMDTFLLEADDAGPATVALEEKMLNAGVLEIRARDLYVGRLSVQEKEANRLFNERVICRAVYSGAKSIHMLVRIADEPSNLDERRWLFAYLCKTLGTKLTFDAQVGDPTRLTRAPITAERITFSKNNVKIIGQQELMFEDWSNVLKMDWRPMYEAWQNQPRSAYEQKGKAMLPTKEIYREAAHAFMEGTYFIDAKWNGKRQSTFFPMYRIVRALGYTYDQVWDEVKEQIRAYYKPEERAYWVSRQNSKVVTEIENDLSDM